MALVYATGEFATKITAVGPDAPPDESSASTPIAHPAPDKPRRQSATGWKFSGRSDQRTFEIGANRGRPPKKPLDEFRHARGRLSPAYGRASAKRAAHGIRDRRTDSVAAEIMRHCFSLRQDLLNGLLDSLCRR